MAVILVISISCLALLSAVRAAPLEYASLYRGGVECEGWRGNLGCGPHTLSDEEQLAIAAENPGVVEQFFETYGEPSPVEKFAVVRNGTLYCSACKMTEAQPHAPARVKTEDGTVHDLFTIASDPSKRQFVYVRYCRRKGKACDHINDLSRIRGSECRQQRRSIAMLAIDGKKRELYPVIVPIPYGCTCYIAR